VTIDCSEWSPALREPGRDKLFPREQAAERTERVLLSRLRADADADGDSGGSVLVLAAAPPPGWKASAGDVPAQLAGGMTRQNDCRVVCVCVPVPAGRRVRGAGPFAGGRI